MGHSAGWWREVGKALEEGMGWVVEEEEGWVVRVAAEEEGWPKTQELQV